MESTPKNVEFVKIISKPVFVDSPMVDEDVEEEKVLTQEPPQQQESIAVSRPRREIRKPARFNDMVAMHSQL